MKNAKWSDNPGKITDNYNAPSWKKTEINPKIALVAVVWGFLGFLFSYAHDANIVSTIFTSIEVTIFSYIVTYLWSLIFPNLSNMIPDQEKKIQEYSHEIHKKGTTKTLKKRKFRESLWKTWHFLIFIIMIIFIWGVVVGTIYTLLFSVEFFGNQNLDFFIPIVYILSIFVLPIGGIYAGIRLKRFFDDRLFRIKSFFEEVHTYNETSPLNDPLFSIGQDIDMNLFLTESTRIKEMTENMIQKRKLARFVFDAPSYQEYKEMIHEKLTDIINLLEKQRTFLGEKITREQEKLTEAKQQVRTYLTETGDNTLEQTAEAQRMRLERQIEEFGKMREMIGE